MIGRLLPLLTLIGAAFLATPAAAVIINSSDGTGNISSCGSYWDNVGTVNGCSCVYLGNDWVLTASHVGSGSVTLNGATYAAVSSSVQRLVTTTSSGAVASDLILFQLQTLPAGLSGLSIASGTYADNAAITAIGYGRNRAAGLTYWDGNWNVTTPSSATYSGYAWASGNTKRWGTNNIDDPTATLIDDGHGTTACLTTTFNLSAGTSEMQAATGDSGGGVFIQNSSGQWTLAGILLAIDDDSLNHAAAYDGSQTCFADLRIYTGQIRAITGVPEPGTMALTAVAASAWLLWRRRKKTAT